MRGFLARPARGQNLRMNFPGYLEEVGAGSGNRTRILSLEGCCTTTVLYPRGADRGNPSSSFGAVAGRLEARGGGSRTRTCEGVRQRIYSPPPLPLGTFPRARFGAPWTSPDKLGRLAAPFEQKPPPTTPAGARPGGCIAEASR